MPAADRRGCEPSQVEEVVRPNLRKWQLFERTDFSPAGEKRRDEFAAFPEDLERQATKFEEQRDRMLAREAAKLEARAG